jgi:hypothetical protein
LRKTPISLSCQSVSKSSCPSVRMYQRSSTVTDLLKIWRWVLLRKSVKRIQFLFPDKNNGRLHEYLSMFLSHRRHEFTIKALLCSLDTFIYFTVTCSSTTHTKRIVVFPLQQCLCEVVTILCYMYTAYFVVIIFTAWMSESLCTFIVRDSVTTLIFHGDWNIFSHDTSTTNYGRENSFIDFIVNNTECSKLLNFSIKMCSIIRRTAYTFRRNNTVIIPQLSLNAKK